jgi:predicted LPLAT superfamily acyltransferase
MGRAWNSRSIGSRFQHGVFYGVIRILGRPAAHLLLRVVVFWYVAFRPVARRRAAPYLSRRFPGQGSLARWRHAYRLVLAFGKALVDQAVLGILGGGPVQAGPADQAELKALLAEGRGLVLLTAHVGGWQMAMAGIGTLDRPVTLVIHRAAGDVEKYFFEHRQDGPPFRILDPAGPLGGMVAMVQALDEGGVLGLMGDRAMGEPGALPVSFLGGTIRVPYSPYRLASATGAPIAVLLAHDAGGPVPVLALARVIRVPAGLGRRPEAYQPYAQQFAQALEAYVAERPYQFFNFYDLWGPAGS